MNFAKRAFSIFDLRDVVEIEELRLSLKRALARPMILPAGERGCTQATQLRDTDSAAKRAQASPCRIIEGHQLQIVCPARLGSVVYVLIHGMELKLVGSLHMTLWVIGVAFTRVLLMLLRILTQPRVARMWIHRGHPDSGLVGPNSIGPATCGSHRFTVKIDRVAAAT
jgi:hypothetical protein